jgi:dynein heavy chain, axonemal
LKFFKVPCKKVYDICDKVNLELMDMEAQNTNLTDSASLFELTPPDKARLILCRKEVLMIKQIWDFMMVVESCINDWKKTPWKRINVEEMEQEIKKFGKDMRGLDKDIRAWAPYLYLESMLKNLMTSLRAITELQNPAIRERHWLELMKATKVNKIISINVSP